MNPSAPPHPHRDRLRDFLRGTLDVAACEEIEAHVVTCTACCDTLSELNLEVEPFLRPLRESTSPSDCQAADVGRNVLAPPPVPAATGSAETWIGRYRLVRLLGEGGMGSVYHAEQEQPIRRSVAVKLIKPGMHGRQFVARFEAERQALALMDHAHITRVLDVGTAPDGRPYLVTELFDGQPITEYCQRHRLTVRERLALFLPVCQAVQHAHHKAVVHRDIKPSNVLVCRIDGQPVPKVIDFGIAKAIGGPASNQETQTRCGQIVGTLEYMSPEQAALNRDDVDTRSDVFALGVLLYELLTGTTPLERHRAESQPLDEVLRAIREEDAERPSVRVATRASLSENGDEDAPPDALTLARSYWNDLDAIVMKALEKDRTRRFASAAELAEDIGRFLAHEPIRARRTTSWGRLARWTRRNPLVASLLAIVTLLVTLSASVFLVLTLRLSFELARSETAERAASRSRTEALDQLWRSYLEQVRATRLSRQEGQQLRSLRLLGEAATIVQSLGEQSGPESDKNLLLRNEAIDCMALADLQRDRQWKLDTPRTLTQAFDVKDARYAYVDAQGRVVVRGILDNRPLASFAPDQPVEVLRFDEAGQTLGGMSYLSSHNKCYLWDLAKRELQATLPHEATDRTLSFSENGQYMAAGQWDGLVRVYRRADHSLVRTYSTTAWPHQIAFAPNGDRVAISCSVDNLVRVMSVESDQPGIKLPHPAGVHGVAWNRDGSLLAAGCDDHCVYLWDVDAKRVHSTLEGHQAGGIHVAFDGSGKRLASHALDGTTLLWDCESGEKLVRARTSGVYQWSADSRYLLGGTTQFAERWAAVRSVGYQTLHHGPTGNQRRRSSVVGPWSLEFDATGLWLASADYDGVRLWAVHDGSLLAHFPVEPRGITAFHPLGGLLTFRHGHLVRWPLDLERVDQASGRDASAALDARQVPSRRLLIGPPQGMEVPADNLFRTGSIVHDHSGTIAAWANLADDQVVVWRTSDTGTTQRLDMPYLRCLALSPDGRWLAAGSQREARLRIWDLEQGSLVHEFTEADGGPIGSLAFDRQSQRLIAGLLSDIRWWRLPAGNAPPRVYPRASSTRPGVAAFSPDGLTIAYTYDNSTIRLLNWHGDQVVAQFKTPGHSVVSRICFSPERSRLAAATENHLIHLWDLTAIRRQLGMLSLDWQPLAAPVEPLEISPVRVEFRWDNVARDDLGPAAVREFRTQFEASTDFKDRGFEFAGSHYRRGLELETSGQIEQAFMEYQAACRLDPTAQHLSARAWMQLRLGRAPQAAADWAGAIEPGSREFWDVYRRAILRLYVGDQDGYRRDCLDLLRRYGSVGAASMAEQLAKVCLLTPSAAGDEQQVRRLVQQALDHDPDHRWYLAVRGLAETRLGDPQLAIRQLHQALESTHGGHPSVDALVQLALSINFYRLERDQEAETAYETANGILTQLLQVSRSDQFGVHWHDWLVCQILSEEIQQLRAAPRDDSGSGA